MAMKASARTAGSLTNTSMANNTQPAQPAPNLTQSQPLGASGATATTATALGTNSTPGGPRTIYGHKPIRELQHVFVKKEFYHEEEYDKTKSVFLPKQFRRLEPVNEKIELLKEQTGYMDIALDDMKKNREEARKQLEAR
jgi:hypothetical protein